MTSLYEQIGEPLIRHSITEFYRRAETDGIIGHFFFHKDLADIIAKQITFATAMLGGPRLYKGKPLGPVHAKLDLRGPHFDRRQVLMAAVLSEMGLADHLRNSWMELEERLRPLIVQQKTYSRN